LPKTKGNESLIIRLCKIAAQGSRCGTIRKPKVNMKEFYVRLEIKIENGVLPKDEVAKSIPPDFVDIKKDFQIVSITDTVATVVVICQKKSTGKSGKSIAGKNISKNSY
jgi:hypothetical protein